MEVFLITLRHYLHTEGFNRSQARRLTSKLTAEDVLQVLTPSNTRETLEHFRKQIVEAPTLPPIERLPEEFIQDLTPLFKA